MILTFHLPIQILFDSFFFEIYSFYYKTNSKSCSKLIQFTFIFKIFIQVLVHIFRVFLFSMCLWISDLSFHWFHFLGPERSLMALVMVNGVAKKRTAQQKLICKKSFTRSDWLTGCTGATGVRKFLQVTKPSDSRQLFGFLLGAAAPKKRFHVGKYESQRVKFKMEKVGCRRFGIK